MRIWTTDLRFLLHNRAANPADSDALRLALISLLDEPNHVSVRTLAVAIMSALSRTELEDVVVAREAVYESAGCAAVAGASGSFLSS